MNKSKEFILTDTMDWEDLGGGVRRKFLGFDNQIMMVKVSFEKGAEGSPHQHFHTQAPIVLQGNLNLISQERNKSLKPVMEFIFRPMLCMEPYALKKVS